MIGLLRGALRRLTPEEVLLDVQGVGYAVRTPLSTYYELERKGLGSEVELLIHTQVRADAIELFGFVTDDEIVLFRRLTGVSGIGPRLAQVILSGMAPGDVVDALVAGDLARLVKIPGVGKKTAERMVLELREAAAELAASGSRRPATTPTEGPELIAALVQLGYRPQVAEHTISAVRREHPDAPFSDQLRLALRALAKV